MKVFELAKELDLKGLELLEKVKPLNLKIKNHMVDLSEEEITQIRNFIHPVSLDKQAAQKKKLTVRKKSTATEIEQKTEIKKIILRREGVIAEEPPVVEAQQEEIFEEELALAQTVLSSRDDSMDIIYDDADEPVSEGIRYVTEDDSFVDSTLVPEAEKITEEFKEIFLKEEKVAQSTSAVPVSAVSAVPGTVIPPRQRYSVIRVVNTEPVRQTNLIVEEPDKRYAPGGTKSKVPAKSEAPKSFSDPTLARTGMALIKESEEEERKKKQAGARKLTDEEILSFKSTDFLRRERVFQPKKKKLAIGQNFKKTQLTTASSHKRVIEFDTSMTVEELASQMAMKAFELAKKLQSMGVTPPADAAYDFSLWDLDIDTVQLVASEFEFEVRDFTFNAENALVEARKKSTSAAADADSIGRSPIITIMGHVDHGKTSLLDLIRRARVASGEAGGITQHIGAYSVEVAEAVKNLAAMAATTTDKKSAKKDKKEAKSEKKTASVLSEKLTFLDTPGHAAFTEIRSRGAKVTDIVILVVAASEGLMPQTREAAEHAKAAGVPIIVAMNKMDLPEANPDKCKQQLSDIGLLPEDWGGETIVVPVSAKTGLGVDKLLEMIQVQAEVLELKANPKLPASGVIIEAKLDKGRGPLATVLIKDGTLRVGDFLVVGTIAGKVRGMIDDKGKQVREAGPAMPVEILGLDQVPEAGDALTVTSDEKTAKNIAEQTALKKAESQKQGGRSIAEMLAQMAAGELKELPIILKSDVKGSAEAISGALQKLPANKVKIKILSSSVGAISGNDVLLASASKAVIFGFNVRPDNKALDEAERRKVEVKTYDIIYNLIDDVRDLMEGLLDKHIKETVVGRAEVRNVFTITKVGAVAGCMVIKGKIQRSNQVRLLRDNRVVFTGKLSGLKRFKDDSKEVAEGFECGMSIENFNDIKVGDVLEAFSIEEIKQSLTDVGQPNA